MNKYTIKFIAILSISVFILSTIGPSLAIVLSEENNEALTIGNEASTITSNSRWTDDDITDTSLSQDMGSEKNSYQQQSIQTDTFSSVDQSNVLSSVRSISFQQQQNLMATSPLLGDPNNDATIHFSEAESSTTSDHHSATSDVSASAPNHLSANSIVLWSEVSQRKIAGLEKISNKYPANLLVNVNSNNNIEFVLRLRNINDGNTLNGLFSTYNINVERPLSSLSSLVVWVPLVNLNVFLQSVSSNTDIIYAEPNGYIHVQYVPNDSYWTSQWGPQLIGMTTAWDYELGSRSIKVAVIDTGIDYTHPDLVNNYLPIGYNWLYNTSDPMDDNGHGTHVAGTIAASINDGRGVAGIANVSIFAEKFLDSGGYGSDTNAALAINHAVAMGANILSNSWGSFFNSSLVADVIADAINSGVIVVAAAGNSNTDLPVFPADLPGVIGVAATDAMDQKASFSNYGEYIDISAPGVNILSDYLGNSYTYMSGTSMATPHVSGLVALLMSKYPLYTANQIENLLYSTAVDLGVPGWDPIYGWGRINAISGIFGFQVHNTQAYINASSSIPVNLNSTLFAVVRNIGLSNEVNITYKIFLNDTLFLHGIILSLSPGKLQSIPINLLPTGTNVYNITLIVDPVADEVVTVDNIASKFIQAVYKQIDVNVGDILSYTYYLNDTSIYRPIEPYEYAWKITDKISPTAYSVSYVIFDSSSQTDFVLYTGVLNPYTRTITGYSWGLFPYWINTTGLTINSKLDLFNPGGQEGIVIGYASYNYYGISVPVLVVDDSYELILFDMKTGVLLSVCYPDINTPIFTSAYTNIHSQGFDLHNLRGIIADVTATRNTITTIYFAVQNTGIYEESSNITLLLNNTVLTTETFSLTPGQCQIFNVSWVFTSSNNLPMELFITPVIDETYLSDNDINVTVFSELPSYFIIHVYNAETYTTITGAEVDVYDYNTNNLVDTGFTNTEGIYKTIGLPIGYYEIQVSAQGFASQYTYYYIDSTGLIIDLYFYMYLPPPRNAHILSPTNGTVVNGSWVTIDYTASDMNTIDYINIYVNGEYIATTYPTNTFAVNISKKLIVPVFRNDTNIILLNFVWYDGSSANASVYADSVHVIPIFYPKTGDFLSYRINMSYINPHITAYMLLNFTFGNWITSTKINVTYTILMHQPYDNGTETTILMEETWFLVDILNGFMDDPAYIAQGFNFFPLTNLGFSNANGHGSLGDVIPFNTWANVLAVEGTTIWKGINVWVLNDDALNSTIYYSRLSGVFVYQKYSFGEELYLTDTSFPLIAPAPTITGPSNLIYELGTTNNTIIWNITGLYPDIYTIMINRSVIVTGKWISGVNVLQNIDGLEHKVYVYTLVASNVGGWNTSSSVIVRVVDIPHLNSPPDIVYYLGTFGAKIVWNATDSDPNTYLITRNGSFVNSGSWRTGVSIIIAVDVLPVGTFSFVIHITDLEGLSASDTVVVVVKTTKPIPPVTPGFDILILISTLSIITTLSILYKKKKL